jgi:hypothetical protein
MGLTWEDSAVFSAFSMTLGLVKIPFLSPVNSPFQDIAGLNLGNLVRPPNSQMVDIVIQHHGIYAEVKNHKDALDSQAVLSVVARLKPDAKVIFLITNRLKDLGGLSDWRTRIDDSASESEIETLVTRIHLSTPKRKFKSSSSASRFHDVNLASIKRQGGTIVLEALRGSAPVPDCRSLVIIIPIKDLAQKGKYDNKIEK